MDAVAESRRKEPVSKHQIQPGCGELTRDGTVKPASRDQILRRERGKGRNPLLCLADHKQYWQPDRLISSLLKVMTMHTYIHTYIHISIIDPPSGGSMRVA